MLNLTKQCKGKDISKVAKSKLLDDGWYASVKIDGNYVRVLKSGDSVRFFTSGFKEFSLPIIAEALKMQHKGVDYELECEYTYGCLGKLGDRRHSARLTTYRTEFAKGIATVDTLKDNLTVFDIINEDEWPDRYAKLQELFSTKDKVLEVAVYTGPFSLAHLRTKMLPIIISSGWEGIFCKHKTHVQEPGKRVNTAIKLKSRPTTDLVCMGVLEGTGKYTNMIGSLRLYDSLRDITVDVGSGLSDFERAKDESYFKGKVVEISYEQLMDTYIQPTYVGVRHDKKEGE